MIWDSELRDVIVGIFIDGGLKRISIAVVAQERRKAMKASGKAVERGELCLN